MKKALLVLVGVHVMAALAVGSAQATSSTLNITGWMAGGGGLAISARYGAGPTDVLVGTYGAGSFAWKLDGVQQYTPLYCLDVFHSFHFGNTWEVEKIIVPPDPPNPPPFNTAEASWIYHKYGFTNNGTEAGGVQLALWEIGHEQFWRTDYHDWGGQWWKKGNFKYTGGVGAAPFLHAKSIIDDLYVNFDLDDAGHSIYYQPTPYNGNNYYYQGQLGAMPEPGVLALLGTGLVSFAGALFRKRPRRV
jgi:hypothetical protein